MSARSRKLKAIVRENIRALQSGAVATLSPTKDSTLKLQNKMVRARSTKDMSRPEWKPKKDPVRVSYESPVITSQAVKTPSGHVHTPVKTPWLEPKE